MTAWRRHASAPNVPVEAPRGSTMKAQKGFTLIELMIVVAIIAILVAIAISQYQDYIIRSQVSEGASLADGAKTALAEFYNNMGRFPSTNASAGLSSPDQIKGNYVNRVNGANGIIVATFSSTAPFKANTTINGQTLSYSAVTTAGAVRWECNKSALLLNQWVPQICRN
jgi:type IV pilus assembly protein PilA